MQVVGSIVRLCLEIEREKKKEEIKGKKPGKAKTRGL